MSTLLHHRLSMQIVGYTGVCVQFRGLNFFKGGGGGGGDVKLGKKCNFSEIGQNSNLLLKYRLKT